ncbi:MAG: 23S rRNA (pseudouridine(1915)-N(3))-methyltransferase RlmH [Halanaerobiales bacterium]|nr:23S rRNA (pseudouridine(1915)-N(3))-methyltransferase RlmH [Halanaerobiales bacterium]
MDLTIIAVGKIKEAYLSEGLKDYIDRLKHYCKLDIVEIESEKTKHKINDAQIEKIKYEEGKRIIDKIEEGKNYIISLDREGKPVSSKGLAKSIKNLQVRGESKITFLIGGSHGLSEEVLGKSDYKMSLSYLTFTHQMSRLIILEQIYRAFKILNNEPYHK